MTVQLETRTPEAVLARIDEIIQELESLWIVVWEGMRTKTNGQMNPNLSQSAHAEKITPRPGSMTAQLWGALGQGTMDEVKEVFAYDYAHELSVR